MTATVQLLTLEQAAHTLNVSQQTLRLWIIHGKLASVKLPSGQYRVHPDTIAALVQTAATVRDGAPA